MAESIINCSNPEQADVVILGAGYDRTSSFGKGADKGPEAIIGCLHSQIEFWDRHSKTCPRDQYKIAYVDLGNLNNLSPEDAVHQIRDFWRDYYRLGKFVVLLGGEHTVTNGALRAITEVTIVRELADEVVVVQIDAHLDLRDTDADFNDAPFGKLSHACVMRRARELEFKTVHVGIRAYSKEERDYVTYQMSRIQVFEWGHRIPKISEIISGVGEGKKIYITLDVDGIDPSFMPATGTPVQGGLDWYYAFELLEELFWAKEVVGFDIVEVAPRPNNDNLTEYGAAQLLYSMLGFKLAKEMRR